MLIVRAGKRSSASTAGSLGLAAKPSPCAQHHPSSEARYILQGRAGRQRAVTIVGPRADDVKILVYPSRRCLDHPSPFANPPLWTFS